MPHIETNQRLVTSFIDLRHCGDNHNHLFKSKAKCVLDIRFVNTRIYDTQSIKYNCMKKGATAETIFHICLCTNISIQLSKEM